MIYKDWKSLEDAIVRNIGVATMETQNTTLIRLSEYLDRFYDTREPKVYVRTGHLGSSASADPFQWTPTGGVGRVYMDMSIPYTTGTYDTETVFKEAEIHGSGIIGNPQFWGDTMNDVLNEIIPNTFGKYFRKK